MTIMIMATLRKNVIAFQPPIFASRRMPGMNNNAFVGKQLYNKQGRVLSAAVSSDSTAADANSSFESKEDYMKHLESIAQLPQGFAVGTSKGSFIPPEAPLMGQLPIRETIIHLTDGPSPSWAAVFTKNKFPGAPVQVGRKILAAKEPLGAIVINNKVSNVCSSSSGTKDAEQVCATVAQALGLDPQTVLPSSTGVIGWKLPVQALCDMVPNAVDNLQSESILPAAQAIMTTDRYPKIRSQTLSNDDNNDNEPRIIGIAKGAGMIEPNMATMLSYILTDVTLPPRSTIQSWLQNPVDTSFNSISVDGDESTSDTVVLVSSNKLPPPKDDTVFIDALQQVCQGLAQDIVRNGEGTSHVMKVEISNFPGTNAQARRLGRHICNSPLFKCAVSGNDPNTGRLAGAIGSFMGKMEEQQQSDDDNNNVDDLTIQLGGRIIFQKGQFVVEGDKMEKELSNHMKNAQYDPSIDYPPHQKVVDIVVDFGNVGTGQATVYGSDLTDEYVSINADYRS